MNFSVVPLARAIGGLSGWRRNITAFIFGVFATLTLAPFFLFPLLLPSFSGLLWLLDAAPSRKRMFWDGWWWGWGFFMSGLYWFCVALLTDPEKFGWLIPPTLFGLNAIIAIYAGVACWLTSWIRVRGISKIVIFTIIWTLVDFARAHLFTGFPWNLIGYSFGFSDASLQMASIIGIYGLTWFAVLLGTSPVALGAKKTGAIYVVALWSVFLFGTFWGAGRLHQANAINEDQRFVKGVLLRLVQANISQPHKWDPALQIQGLKEHISLTQSPGLDAVTHVIWPETAVPFAITADTPITRKLGAILPSGKILITGSLRTQGDEKNFQLWNSLSALDHEGNIVGYYDKIRLVPFGEFLPFRRFFPKSWLTPVGDVDFSTGTGGHLAGFPNLPPTLPLICYEVIFTELPLPDDLRPQLLLSVTNDAWFGSSTGPYQHFEMARMRSVEQGVPMVRVANTGISAVIDSFGQVVSSIPLLTKGVLDVRLPYAQAEATWYHKLKGYFFPLLLMIGLILIVNQRNSHKY